MRITNNFIRALFLIASIFVFSCSNKEDNDPIISTDIKYFKAVENNDIKLQSPQEGEWLYDHKEKGQTF